MRSEKDFDAQNSQDLTCLMEQARAATRAYISNLKVGKKRT